MMTSAPELQGTFETILSPRGCGPGLTIGAGAARGVKLGGSADFQSMSISRNRRKPRRIFGARLCAQHQPQHGRDSNALRLGLRPQPRSILVAAWPRCAVSRVSKPAGGTISHAPPIWKSAIQQVWKPALRRAVAPLENLRRKTKISQRVVRMDTNGTVSGIRVHSCSFVVSLVWVAARPP